MWNDFVGMFLRKKNKKEITNRLHNIITKDKLAIKLTKIIAIDYELETSRIQKIKKEVNAVVNRIIKAILISKTKLVNTRKNQNKKGDDTNGINKE